MYKLQACIVNISSDAESNKCYKWELFIELHVYLLNMYYRLQWKV